MHASNTNKTLHDGGGIGESRGVNVATVNRANELNHAKCILNLTYTKFDWSERDLMNFHRPRTEEIFDEMQSDLMRA